MFALQGKYQCNLAEELKQVMMNQCQDIVEHCNTYHQHSDKSVHEIRKSFKRLRALLRLIRDEIGYSTYYRENQFYKSRAALISGLRDLQVFIEDIQALQKRYKTELDHSFSDDLISLIKNEKDTLFAKATTSQNVFETIKDDLKEDQDRIQSFDFKNTGFESVQKGISRVYKKGAGYLELCHLNMSTENLHDLRKQVKYLMYQMNLFVPVWPKFFKAYIKTLDKTAEELGDDHNYAVLIAYLETVYRSLDKRKPERFITWLQSKRRPLQKSALINLDKVYIDPPEVFVGRIGKMWELFCEKQKSIKL